jgi:hypothetical protein
MFPSFSSSHIYLIFRLSFGMTTSLRAEPETWTPPEGAKWDTTDYNAEFKKLEEEAKNRLDEKISELMSNIENVGKKN